MNIYIKIEILPREAEGRFLLGLVAAERGHRVLIGDFSALLSHRLWLPPGIFHDNSLTPSASKLALLARLRDAGFIITSQDEEHGLLDDFGSWADFAARRFSSDTIACASRCFMWGPHDHKTLKELHPDAAEKIIQTGSPRVDFWRPELDGYFAKRELPGIDPRRPFVLFANQGSMVLDHNRFWQRMADQRPRYFDGDDDEREWAWYQRCVGEVRYLEHVVPAIRAIARENEGLQVVIRPHPLEMDGAWEALVGDIPGVTVARAGTASAWLRRAAAIVHNGSTIGFEAAAARRPLISFQPIADRSDFVSNRLGRTANDREELLQLVRQAVAGRAPYGGWHPESQVLEERLGTLQGRLAADEIVDGWEEVGSELADHVRLDVARARRMSNLHRAVGRGRSRLRGDRHPAGFQTGHKFSAFSRGEMLRSADELRQTLGRFANVSIRLRGPRLVELRRSRG